MSIYEELDLTVFIVTFNERHALFTKCCESVIKAIPLSAEIRVIINGDAPLTETWLYNLNHPQIFWRKIPLEPRAKSRNRAFFESRGKIIYFLDDDVIVPEHLFLKVINKFKTNSDVIAIGGPNLTPPNSPIKEKIFGAVLTSFFAAPFVRFRYCPVTQKDISATEKELILCNLAIRNFSEVKTIGFNAELSSNEENLLLHILQKKKFKILYSPDLFIYHHRRKKIYDFLMQIMSYGKGRAEQFIKYPNSIHPIFLVPVLSSILGFLLLFFGKYKILLILILIHFILSFLAALCSSEIRKTGYLGIIFSTLLTIVLHFFYALGFIRGFIKLPNVKPPVIEPVKGLKST